MIHQHTGRACAALALAAALAACGGDGTTTTNPGTPPPPPELSAEAEAGLRAVGWLIGGNNVYAAGNSVPSAIRMAVSRKRSHRRLQGRA